LPITTIRVTPNLQVEAELAYTDSTRMKGLMYRKYLAPDAGMLFVFRDLDLHSFWMKNTLISLDLIWLNERKEIVASLTVDPCEKDPCQSYEPMQKSKYVLEVNGGFVKKHNLKVGDQLEFTIPPEVERTVQRNG
jgi:uncharacterized membrane protein (UPF0127 family)